MAETGALGFERDVRLHKHAINKTLRFPKRLTFGEKHEILDAAAGYGFSIYAVKPDKEYGLYTLYGTGLNSDSQIGYHKLRGKTYKPMELLIHPAPITLPQESPDEVHTVTKVACGRAHTVAVTSAGKIFTLGNNSYGQCGREIVEDEEYFGSEVINIINPNLFNNEVMRSVICGQDHTMFLTESGRLYACGWGADGQTGLGHYNNHHEPTRIDGEIKGENITKVSSVGDCVLALNDKGEVFGWGNSEYNQILLNSDEQQVNHPVHLKYLSKFGKIIDVAAGGSFSMVLNENGDVFVWGYGLLGFGPAVDICKMPKQIPPTLFGRNAFNPNLLVTSINCGLYHMAAINSDNDLFMWGKNTAACLGLGHDQNQYFPFKANVPAKVHKILCGVDHCIALCKPFI